MAVTSTQEIVSEINAIRASLPPRGDWRTKDSREWIAAELEGSPILASQPAVQALVADLRDFTPGSRMERTKRLLNEGQEGLILSLFDASYFPKLSLDVAKYRVLATDGVLCEKYSSPTAPVALAEHSKGFESRVVVALFPENHLDGIQTPTDRIFYFIDKFVERHQRVTQKMIKEVMEEGAFPRLGNAASVDIERASSWWVHLHEYHHRQGYMPIPDYLEAKSSKPLAGLEELRTDVSSMLVCLNDGDLPVDDAALAYEYILAERLLRYSVEGIPRPNYDAVASQLLFTYLIQFGGIALKDGKISLGTSLPGILSNFLGEIESIESVIARDSVDHVKDLLLDFTNRYTEFDSNLGDYKHIPYFAEVKARLGI
ncbi:DUF6421 family protein [Streptomyces sp. NBC_00441]|uniref:DUF6421 family protein n=1 Tax=Streptomyces sp. NBC_00441 TaxID=2975742 RepID=UPI002E28FE23|nr:DUF6421 family protein [Streptomyces sp. NBC_00441]